MSARAAGLSYEQLCLQVLQRASLDSAATPVPPPRPGAALGADVADGTED
jgi:hypothetical protein